MMRDVEAPNPDDLNDAPELGALAILSASLRITRWSLVAQHPELLEQIRPYWCSAGSPQTLREARRILRLSVRLHAAVLAYCATIPTALTPVDDNIPF